MYNLNGIIVIFLLYSRIYTGLHTSLALMAWDFETFLQQEMMAKIRVQVFKIELHTYIHLD